MRDRRGRAGRGGVNEELETAENHRSLLGLQNTTEKWYFRKSHSGDTWRWLEPQQGLPVGAGFTKGKLFRKSLLP